MDRGDRATPAGRSTLRALPLSTRGGAQTSLYCATQPDLPSGAYFHNTLGRVELRPDDPGADVAKASVLWDALEGLSGDAQRPRRPAFENNVERLVQKEEEFFRPAS